MAIREWRGQREVRAEMVAIRSASYDRERRGPKLTLEVWDSADKCRAVFWTPATDLADAIVRVSQGDEPFVYVWGSLADTPNYGEQLTLTNVDFLRDGECPDISLWQQELRPDHGQMIAGLDRLIASVRDPDLSRLLHRTIATGGQLRECYLTATAAKVKHHAFPGGLLHHSVEVAEVALHMRASFSGLNRDLLLTAALLHDIGKLWEMRHDWQCGEYTDSGSLLGHLYIGAGHLDRVCRNLKFSDDLREMLLHAILAHHEKREFGSPVTPLTAEAIALAKADQISAELTQFFDAQTRQTGQTKRLVRRGERTFFIGFPNTFPKDATDDAVYGLTSEASLRDLPPPNVPTESDPEERLMRRLMERSTAHVGDLDEVQMADLPLLGLVAAFDGIRAGFAEEGEPETRRVRMPPGGADFALKVVGDSMTGAGMMDGDLLIVRKQEGARIGQIVVAIVPQIGPVVKRLIEQGDCRFLASENPAYPPIPVTEGVQVQGVVVRLERELS